MYLLPNCSDSLQKINKMNVNCIQSNEDFFNRLSDEIVASIFQKLQDDVKSLCFSMSVCTRFRSIVPQVLEQVFFAIPRRILSATEDSGQVRCFGNHSLKYFYSLSQKIKSIGHVGDDDHVDMHLDVNEILQRYREIRELHLRMPCRKKNSKPFLKWNAEFGEALRVCVILCAKSWTEKHKNGDSSNSSDRETGLMPRREYRRTVRWALSCLRAACRRHYLIRQIVKLGRHETLESVVVSDEIEQGRLYMNKQQIQDAREAASADRDATASEHKDRIPKLKMYMWHLKRLEVPDGSGMVMKGATMVLILPAGHPHGISVVGILEEAGFAEKMALIETVSKFAAPEKFYNIDLQFRPDL